MTSFATELSGDIRRQPKFWEDLAGLRAVGIRSTLVADVGEQPSVSGPQLEEDGLARLLNSASVFALSEDEQSRDLAQQIAVFASLITNEAAVLSAASHILSGLGNFPGLTLIENKAPEQLGLQARLRSALLRQLNSVKMEERHVALTEFQLEVWKSLKEQLATAISAPTSAGKSFVVLEHLCESALAASAFTALYIAPTRALLAEIQGKLERRLGAQTTGVRVTTIPVPDPEQRPRQIYVLTQERAQLLLSTLNLDDVVDLVIVDEAQAIGDESRGMILQDALEKVREANPKVRFLFLAPGASGFDLVGESVGLSQLHIKETSLSPVVQNRISVRFPNEDEHSIHLDLVTPDRLEPIGSYKFKRGYALGDDAKLAAVAQEFGAAGRSLVYATGPKNAEDLTGLIALNRPAKGQGPLNDLAAFIEKHVHKQYSLARFVRHGVAFHYGNMPSLLREGIEAAFRNGELDYLCCTTTLFQGVNLPARNVFIDTPTRGNKGELLDEAELWNFAGRAGRLGEEVVGNVFLVNYENWDEKLLTKRKPFQLKVAFKETLEGSFDAVLELLEIAGSELPDAERKRADERTTAAAGLVLFRASQGNLSLLLGRGNINLSSQQFEELGVSANSALERLGLPASVLANSWMIDPVALASLLKRIRELVRAEHFGKLIPTNPSLDSKSVYDSVIRRLFKQLGGLNLSGEEGRKTKGYVNHVTVTALKWMRGDPLTKLVDEAVRYKLTASKQSANKKSDQVVVDGAIRDMFQTIEQTIRFKLVQWAKAYVDLVKFALTEAGRTDLVEQVYDFSLALELGVSTGTGRSLVEFGLSRISASAVASLITDSSLTPDEVKAWLRSQQEDMLSQLSPLIRTELQAKGLLPAVPQQQPASDE